jgi:hypothetical protein
MGQQKGKPTCPLWKIQEEEKGKRIESLFRIIGEIFPNLGSDMDIQFDDIHR